MPEKEDDCPTPAISALTSSSRTRPCTLDKDGLGDIWQHCTSVILRSSNVISLSTSEGAASDDMESGCDTRDADDTDAAVAADGITKDSTTMLVPANASTLRNEVALILMVDVVKYSIIVVVCIIL